MKWVRRLRPARNYAGNAPGTFERLQNMLEQAQKASASCDIWIHRCRCLSQAFGLVADLFDHDFRRVTPESVLELVRILQTGVDILHSCSTRNRSWEVKALLTSADFEHFFLSLQECVHGIIGKLVEDGQHDYAGVQGRIFASRISDFVIRELHQATLGDRKHMSGIKAFSRLLQWEELEFQGTDFQGELPTFLSIDALKNAKVRMVIGSGSFGYVYESKVLGCVVAVKVFKKGGDLTFRKELGALLTLRHPTIVRVYGFFHHPVDRQYSIVMERMSSDLSFLVQHHQQQEHQLDILVMLSIVSQIAAGMKFLHSKNVIHRDLKPGNILVNRPQHSSDIQVKIADFGTSRLHFSTSTATTSVGTLGFTAPEVYETATGFMEQKYSKKVDVFSFAMVCYYILTGKLPYEESLRRFEVIKMVRDHYMRPRLPESCPEKLAGLITRCWDGRPDCRPDFEEICVKLKEIQAHIESSFVGLYREEAQELTFEGVGKLEVMIRRLRLCSVVFDFTDPSKNIREKEMKRQKLLELVEFVASLGDGDVKREEAWCDEVVKMVSVNLFRSLPSTHSSFDLDFNPSGEEEEDEDPVLSLEPAWPHLQLIYELLLRFVVSAHTDSLVARRYIDQSFVQRLLDLFDSEDPREREYLKTILHRIYGKFMMHRPFIRKVINNIIYTFEHETEKHNGISELLEFLGSVINGFVVPLKEEHKLFLLRVLIPLHKLKCMAVYHEHLSYCVTQFVEKDVKLATTVILGLLKYWPVTNSQKEVLFLGELQDILAMTPVAEFQRCMVPLFRQLSRCLSSLHFQVAERALLMWNNDHIVSLVTQNRQIVLLIVFSALERNRKNHWNQTVHRLTVSVQKMFLEMDMDLFEECLRKHEEDEAKSKFVKEKREYNWKRLEAIAAAKAFSSFKSSRSAFTN